MHEYMYLCVFIYLKACVRACSRGCVCVCARVCARVCVCGGGLGGVCAGVLPLSLIHCLPTFRSVWTNCFQSDYLYSEAIYTGVQEYSDAVHTNVSPNDNSQNDHCHSNEHSNADNRPSKRTDRCVLHCSKVKRCYFQRSVKRVPSCSGMVIAL